MLQSCPIEESIYSERYYDEFWKCYSSSSTKEFESFVEDFVAYEDDEDHRENDISISKNSDIYSVESDNSIESENKQHEKKI